MSEPSNYGNLYWCIKVPTEVSKDGEIYVYADSINVIDGTLLMMRHKKLTEIDEIEQPNLILAPSQWIAVFAASLMDGSAVAVQSWEGEVDR